MSKLSILRRSVPPSVTRKAGLLMLQAKAQSPHILFGVGIVGFGATVVLSSRATLKVSDILDETQKNLSDIKSIEDNAELSKKHKYTPDDATRDRIVVYTQAFVDISKLYAPSFACGVLTIAAFSKAHAIQNARIGALAAAYTGLDRAFRLYREQVREIIGEEAERDIRYDARVESVEILHPDGGKSEFAERKKIGEGAYSMYARFFDETCDPWQKNPEYNWVFLRAQQQYANDMLKSRGYLFLNDVYKALGIEPTEAGQVVGWILGPDGDNYVDFGFLDGSKPRSRDFVNGHTNSVFLDFNVDGYILDKVRAPGWRSHE